MKLQEVKTKEVKLKGDFKHTDFRISTDNAAVIMDLLSKGFYQNPIDSIVREYCANSWDSHVEAGCQDQAVVVRFSSDENTDFIEFVDYGVGLSPKRMEEVFTVYFESSKRDTNDQIGSFGLGSKSAYAYTDSFYVTTRYEGVEYQYLMSKNEVGISRLTEIINYPTDEGNGTAVKIPLKNTRSRYSYSYRDSDIDKFYKACERQLCYFDNVYIDKSGVDEFNTAKIHRFKYFTFSELVPYTEMHIKLGQCAYQIPWSDLGKPRISIPVAINFEIGEIIPTPNREGIILTEDTKALLLERIELVKEELLGIYRDQNKPLEDWKEWLRIKTQYNHSNTHIIIGIKRITISSILTSSEVIPVRLEGIRSSICLHAFLSNWYYSRKIKNVLTSTGDAKFSAYSLLREGPIIYTIQGQYNKYTNKYIAEVLHPDDEVWIIRSSKLTLKQYKIVLNLISYPKSEWRWRIVEYQKLLASIWTGLPSYDKVKPPEEWIKSSYKKRTTRDLSGKAVCYVARYPNRVSDNYAAYNKEVHTFEKLSKLRGLVIYGEKTDRKELDKIFTFVAGSSKNIKVMYTTSKNYKQLEELQNFMHLDKFKVNYNRYFSKTVTAYMFNQFINKNSFYFCNTKFIGHLYPEMEADMDYMTSYISAHWNNNYSRRGYYGNELDAFYASCWDVAVQNKLYDHVAIAVFKRVWNFIDVAGQLEMLRTVNDGYGTEIIPAAIEVAKKLLGYEVKKLKVKRY